MATYFMVWAAGRRQRPGTGWEGPAASVPTELVWDNGPIGVFKVDVDGDEGAELACHAGARKHGHAGTYFAIEGYPYGLAVQAPEGVSELGEEEITQRPALEAG